MNFLKKVLIVGLTLIVSTIAKEVQAQNAPLPISEVYDNIKSNSNILRYNGRGVIQIQKKYLKQQSPVYDPVVKRVTNRDMDNIHNKIINNNSYYHVPVPLQPVRFQRTIAPSRSYSVQFPPRYTNTIQSPPQYFGCVPIHQYNSYTGTYFPKNDCANANVMQTHQNVYTIESQKIRYEYYGNY